MRVLSRSADPAISLPASPATPSVDVRPRGCRRSTSCGCSSAPRWSPCTWCPTPTAAERPGQRRGQPPALHRQAFFFISALVLVHTHRRSPELVRGQAATRRAPPPHPPLVHVVEQGHGPRSPGHRSRPARPCRPRSRAAADTIASRRRCDTVPVGALQPETDHGQCTTAAPGVRGDQAGGPRTPCSRPVGHRRAGWPAAQRARAAGHPAVGLDLGRCVCTRTSALMKKNACRV